MASFIKIFKAQYQDWGNNSGNISCNSSEVYTDNYYRNFDCIGFGTGVWKPTAPCPSQTCCTAAGCGNYTREGGYSASANGWQTNCSASCTHLNTSALCGPTSGKIILYGKSDLINTLNANRAKKARISGIRVLLQSRLELCGCISDYYSCSGGTPCPSCGKNPGAGFQYHLRVPSIFEYDAGDYNTGVNLNWANYTAPNGLNNMQPIGNFINTLQNSDLDLYWNINYFNAPRGQVKYRLWNFQMEYTVEYTSYIENFTVIIKTEPEINAKGILNINTIGNYAFDFDENRSFTKNIGFNGTGDEFYDGDYQFSISNLDLTADWYIVDEIGGNVDGTINITEGGSYTIIIKTRLKIDGNLLFTALNDSPDFPGDHKSNILYSLVATDKSKVFNNDDPGIKWDVYDSLCDINNKTVPITKEAGLYDTFIYYNAAYELLIEYFNIQDENEYNLLSFTPNQAEHVFGKDLSNGDVKELNPNLNFDIKYEVSPVKYDTDVTVKVYEIDNKELYDVNNDVNHLFQDHNCEYDYSADFKGVKNVKQFKRENF